MCLYTNILYYIYYYTSYLCMWFLFVHIHRGCRMHTLNCLRVYLCCAHVLYMVSDGTEQVLRDREDALLMVH